MKQLQIETAVTYNKLPTTLIIPITEKKSSKQLRSVIGQFSISEKKAATFKGKSQETLVLYPTDEKNLETIVLIGLGKELASDDFETAVRTYIHKNKYELPTVVGFDFLQETLQSLEEPILHSLIQSAVGGLNLGLYEIGMLKTKASLKDKEINTPETIVYCDEKSTKNIEKVISEAKAISDTQKKILTLMDLPGNYMNATTLAAAAIESGKENNYKVTVLNKSEIEKEGLGALLAVNYGSAEPPTFSILEYKPKNSKKLPKIALVGKGITFDTGGLSIKTSEGMYHMKSDMGGGAAVLGALELAAKLELPVHLIGVIPSTDNKTGANAIQPGDVVTSHAGITIEVENTDAEGRLVLADGVSYVNTHFQPDVIIDLATLTGACVVALGYNAAGMFTNNDELSEQLTKAGECSKERVWRMPAWDSYQKQLDSDIADIKNLGGAAGGAITAAKFIQYFTNEHPKWAHIDIAGTAYGRNAFCKGMSGTAFGVKLLIAYLKGL